jgi:preprotein translocase subunit SecG
MEFLYWLVIILFVAVSGFLVFFVLNQEPKQTGSDMLGGTSDLFATRGMTGGLYRVTVVLGAVFALLAFVIGLWQR